MTPIRAEGPVVEPVSLSEMRAYLRLDADDGGAEDALVLSLIAAARAGLEVETRRVLVPGRFRLALSAWPAGGVLALPLSPLVALTRAALVDGTGSVADLAPGLVRLGPDPVEAPGLVIDPAAPSPAGLGILIEVSAGYGGDGPPLPEPLRLAILRRTAAAYEHRGDEAEPDADTAALVAPFRRLRL